MRVQCGAMAALNSWVDRKTSLKSKRKSKKIPKHKLLSYYGYKSNEINPKM